MAAAERGRHAPFLRSDCRQQVPESYQCNAAEGKWLSRDTPVLEYRTGGILTSLTRRFYGSDWPVGGGGPFDCFRLVCLCVRSVCVRE